MTLASRLRTRPATPRRSNSTNASHCLLHDMPSHLGHDENTLFHQREAIVALGTRSVKSPKYASMENAFSRASTHSYTATRGRAGLPVGWAYCRLQLPSTATYGRVLRVRGHLHLSRTGRGANPSIINHVPNRSRATAVSSHQSPSSTKGVTTGALA